MEKKIVRKRQLIWAAIVASLLCLAYAVWSMEYALVVVSGPSMEPTYHDGDKLIVTRVKGIEELPHNYPVCVLYDPDNNLVIKRLIGYPGDSVRLEGGTTLVNGKDIFGYRMAGWDELELDVPASHCLFLGDNRLNSVDARFWEGTYTKEDHIIGYIPDSGLEVN